MGTCACCGNDYENTFEVSMDGERFEFDSFECAIHKLAPSCRRCGCRVLGHGVQDGEIIYCGAHCANESGADGLVDHA